MVPFSAPRWDGRGQSAWRSAERGSLRADLLSRRNGDSARFLFPPKALVLAVAGFLVALTVLMASLLNVDLDRQLASAALLGRQEESSLLTGRVPIWQELLRYVCERPWTGYGYESFWTPLHIEEFSKEMHWRFREAHSSYLDAVLSVGLIGAGALLAAVLLALARARTLFRLTGDPGYGLSLGLLAFALVSATLESGMASMNFFSLVIGCGIVQLLSRISRP